METLVGNKCVISYRDGAINRKGDLPIESNSMITVVEAEVESGGAANKLSYQGGGHRRGRMFRWAVIKKVDAYQNYQKENILRFELGHHGGFASPSCMIKH